MLLARKNSIENTDDIQLMKNDEHETSNETDNVYIFFYYLFAFLLFFILINCLGHFWFRLYQKIKNNMLI